MQCQRPGTRDEEASESEAGESEAKKPRTEKADPAVLSQHTKDRLDLFRLENVDKDKGREGRKESVRASKWQTGS